MQRGIPHRWISWVVAAPLLLLPCAAIAINTSLQPEEIEEAYSLGQTSNHEDLANFLKQYEHDFQYPADHPVAYVESVEFQTPYDQIVLRSHQKIGYTKFQAADDYKANPELVIVRVITALRINYGGRVPPADSYQVVVSQGSPIEPRKATNTVTCDPFSQTAYPTMTDCTVYTREILLRFDAAQFGPGRATVKVSLPEGQSLETSFNLDKLK